MFLIAAINEEGVIGKNNDLPWKIKEDLKRFRELTTGHIIVMGRKTFESFPSGPLPNRIHVVITSNKSLHNETDECVHYIPLDDSTDYIMKLQENLKKNVFVIGGASIYDHFFSVIKRFYITLVKEKVRGSENELVYFPKHPSHFLSSEFLGQHIATEYTVKEGYTFVIFERCLV